MIMQKNSSIRVKAAEGGKEEKAQPNSISLQRRDKTLTSRASYQAYGSFYFHFFLVIFLDFFFLYFHVTFWMEAIIF